MHMRVHPTAWCFLSTSCTVSTVRHRSLYTAAAAQSFLSDHRRLPRPEASQVVAPQWCGPGRGRLWLLWLRAAGCLDGGNVCRGGLLACALVHSHDPGQAAQFTTAVVNSDHSVHLGQPWHECNGAYTPPCEKHACLLAIDLSAAPRPPFVEIAGVDAHCHWQAGSSPAAVCCHSPRALERPQAHKATPLGQITSRQAAPRAHLRVTVLPGLAAAV